MTLIGAARRKYVESGAFGLLAALPGYLRWIIEYGVIARIAFAILARFNGTVDASGITIAVDERVGPETTYRLLTGRYEREERTLLDRYLPDGVDVVELGGGTGFISCYVNQMLGSNATHVVVEANPTLVPLIETNCRANDAECLIRNAAYSPSEGTVTFVASDAFESGRVDRSAADGTEVESVSLRRLLEETNVDEFALVADIEGGEFDMFDAEMDVIGNRCVLMVVEFHPESSDQLARAFERIEGSGFSLVDGRDDVYVFQNGSR